MDDVTQIDEAIVSWAELVPDLDVVTMRSALLIARAAAVGGRHVGAAFTACGISAGEFDVIASLLHAPDHTAKPSELAKTGMLSPAGMTHRLDLLERAGLVERSPDPHDRRSTRITLTPAGRTTAIDAARAHVAAEAEVLGALTGDEQRQLDELMTRLLRAYRQPDEPTPAPERQGDTR